MSLNLTRRRIYGCRQLRHLFTKWTLLIAVCTSDEVPNDGMDEPKTRSCVRRKHYDVLLSSYMRSGSSLTGKILGWRTDTFYVYEPLWKSSFWTYWHGNNTICRTDRLDCRMVDPGDAVTDKSFPDNNNNIERSHLMERLQRHPDIEEKRTTQNIPVH